MKFEEHQPIYHPKPVNKPNQRSSVSIVQYYSSIIKQSVIKMASFAVGVVVVVLCFVIS